MNTLEDRIFRCDVSDFYHNEIESVNETHTDLKLKAIADAGFNGIWLRGIIRELVSTTLFKDYFGNVEKAQNQLKLLCQRAKKFGLGVWLYFTEPLGLPSSHLFCKEHPELMGPETIIPISGLTPCTSLCSSTPQVREYLTQGFAQLVDLAPLRGIILTTTSEQISNCWAHVLSNPSSYPDPEEFWASQCRCPRCSKRSPLDVISEILEIIYSSVKSTCPETKIVAWDWSWNMHFEPPYKNIIQKLPADMILMGDFERGGTVEHQGKTRLVEEYSLVYSGPSDRFDGEVKLTSSNRNMFAKLQINTTHELATVPNLPLMISLYRKLSYLKEACIKGVMASWNFGLFTDTLNLFAFNKFCKQSTQGHERDCLKSLAVDYFGNNVDADATVDAWYAFQNAVQYYPINGNKFVYFSPVNYALSFPLKAEFTGIPMGISCFLPKGSDRLEDSLGSYTLKEVIDLLGKLTTEWFNACNLYKQALSSADNIENKEKEFGVAFTAGCCFRSTHNIYRWYQQRNGKPTKELTGNDIQIINDEIGNLERALPFIEADERLGYHQECNSYMFSSVEIKNKIYDLKG